MSKSSNVGISPVLLQAISQSLSSSRGKSLDTDAKMSSPVIPTNGKGDNSEVDIMSKIMREQQGVSSQVNDENEPSSSDALKTMLKIKMTASALSKLPNQLKVVSGKTGDTSTVSSSGKVSTLASDLAMANALTALASQAGRLQSPVNIDTGQITAVKIAKSVESTIESESDLRAVQVGDQKIQIKTEFPTTEISSERRSVNKSASSEELSDSDMIEKQSRDLSERRTLSFLSSPLETSNDSISESVREVTVHTESAEDSTSASTESVLGRASDARTKSESPFVLAFNPVPGTSDQNIIDMSTNTVRIIEHNGKRYIIQMQDIEKDASSSSEKEDQCVRFSTGQESQDSDSSPYTNVVEQEIVTVGQLQDSSGVPLPTYKPNMAAMNGTPCPVCGDNVSGMSYSLCTNSVTKKKNMK